MLILNGFAMADKQQETTTTTEGQSKESVALTTNSAGSETKVLTQEEFSRDVSAATVGKMLGLATARDLRLLEEQINLLATRITNMTARFDRVLTSVSKVATGGDLDRLEAQIATLRTFMRDSTASILDSLGQKPNAKPAPAAAESENSNGKTEESAA